MPILPSFLPVLRLSLLLSIVFLGGRDLQAQQSNPASSSLEIRNVNVVDVRQGRVLRDQTVAIAGDTIRSVAPTEDAGSTSAARTIDGAGRYLIPGLWDMHAHLRGNGLPAWITTDWMMPLLLAHGVTGVRDMNSDCDGPDQGPVCLDQMRAWQMQVDEGSLLGPRILALSSWQVNPPWDYEVSEEQARQVARTFADQRLDLVKVYFRLSPEAFGWIMDESSKLGLAAGGHIPLRVTITEASNAGLRSLEHARDFLFDCFLEDWVRGVSLNVRGWKSGYNLPLPVEAPEFVFLDVRSYSCLNFDAVTVRQKD